MPRILNTIPSWPSVRGRVLAFVCQCHLLYTISVLWNVTPWFRRWVHGCLHLWETLCDVNSRTQDIRIECSLFLHNYPILSRSNWFLSPQSSTRPLSTFSPVPPFCFLHLIFSFLSYYFTFSSVYFFLCHIYSSFPLTASSFPSSFPTLLSLDISSPLPRLLQSPAPQNHAVSVRKDYVR